MKKLALAFVLLAAACGDDPLTADEVRAALPKKEAIQIATPRDAGSAAVRADRPALLALGAEPQVGSELAAATFWTAATVNVGVWWTLFQLEVVTMFPPTACEDDACTWGPYEDDDGLNAWQLAVSRDGSGYRYVLAAQPLSRPELGFLPLVSGVAYGSRERHRGHGSFDVDFDAAADLDHAAGWEQEDFGTLAVTYDNRGELSVHALALGARSSDPADPVFMDAVYAFQAGASGGTLDVAFETQETVSRNLSLRSRWNGTGAGRGDAKVNMGNWTYVESECWGAAPAAELLFDDGPEPDVGDAALCAYASAEYSALVLP